MDKQQHIRVLGWLFVAYGALIVLGAVTALLGAFLGGIFSGSISATGSTRRYKFSGSKP